MAAGTGQGSASPAPGRLRLGIIGAGIMGSQVAHKAAALGKYAVTAVADADYGRGHALAEDVGATAFPDAQRLLASGLADAVYVGVPHHLHLPVCLEAAAAGVHVLVDKPLCNSDLEADAIETAVAGTNATWMVGFSYRFRAEWQRAHDLVAAGRIGTPVAIVDVIAEAAQQTPAWYWDPASGGGVLQLQAHHCFDRIAWLTASAVRDVSCVVYATPGRAGTAAHITAQLESGAVAGISLTFGTTYPAPVRALFVLQGTMGQIEITQGGELSMRSADGATVERYDDDDWLGRELTEFAAAVGRGGPAVATVADGHAALRCALAAASSAATGVRVAVTA